MLQVHDFDTNSIHQPSMWLSIPIVFVNYFEIKSSAMQKLEKFKTVLSLWFRHCCFLRHEDDWLEVPVFQPGSLKVVCGAEKHTFRSKSAVVTDWPPALLDPGLVPFPKPQHAMGTSRCTTLQCLVSSAPQALHLFLQTYEQPRWS